MAQEPAPHPPLPPIFDGHNDTLLALHQHPERSFTQRNEAGHIDLPRAREGGLAGGFFAVFPPGATRLTAPDADSNAGPNASPTPPPAPQPPLAPARAVHETMAITARLFALERKGALKIVRTAADLQHCLSNGIFAAILHFEGAEAIEPLEALELYYQAGLRSLGLVWSRPNQYGSGVPFEFPGSPDIGPGLTAAGRELVRACNDLGILIDLSHLNERGFWEVAERSNAPLVATHSNAHALCPTPRNLTDEQLAAIKASDGMVGLNFAVSFLREDGQRDPDTPLETMVRHLDYLVEHLGIDRVGLGSDFDGALIPNEIGDASGLPKLLAALRAHGYDDAGLRKLAHENWLRVLQLTWKA